MLQKLAFLVVFIFACSPEKERIRLRFVDAGSSDDAGEMCRTTQIISDFANCGTCGLSCNVDNADRCREGFCMCGNLPACGDGEDCRWGFCHPVDLSGAICEFDSECPSGNICVEAHCSPRACSDHEECNGLDDDCDGVIDRERNQPLVRLCGDAPRPPCQHGVNVCVDGSWSACQGAIEPLTEARSAACNGIDDDCDGCVDGVMADGVCETLPIPSYDIVFAVDASGSMGVIMPTVIEAIKKAVAENDRTGFRFSLLLFPGSSDQVSVPDVLHPLTSASLFMAAEPTTKIEFAMSGYEPSWDIIHDVGNGTINLGFSLASQKTLIMFTDEEGQSYAPIPHDEARACQTWEDSEVLAVFTTSNHGMDFDQCAQVYPLSNVNNSLTATVRDLVEDKCL